MIKNERQYKITRAQAGRLRKALGAARARGTGDGGGTMGTTSATSTTDATDATAGMGIVRESGGEYMAVHPLIAKAQQEALNSQLADLEGELTEYEALKDGEFDMDALNGLADIPMMLIKARIATGLSQRELAERLGLKEQQIQQYEATEYASASLTRIREVAAAYVVGGIGEG